MTRSARWLFAAALLPVAACSSQAPAPVAATPPAPPPLAQADAAFVNTAAASDSFEVQAGQLAATKARSARVKHFASDMVTAHTQTTQQLTGIAQTKGVTPDATLNQDQQAMLTKLNADSPRAFDHDYMHGQFLAHTAAVQAFQAEISGGQDADIKGFATQTLPTIQMHLREARALGGAR